MKYFIAIEEDLLQKLWMYDPSLVAPFSRPFYPRELNQCCLRINLEAQSLLMDHEAENESKTEKEMDVTDPFKPVSVEDLLPASVVPEGSINDENIAHLDE